MSDLLSGYCFDGKIIYLATKTEICIIDTYLCICLVIDYIQSVANMMSL